MVLLPSHWIEANSTGTRGPIIPYAFDVSGRNSSCEPLTSPLSRSKGGRSSGDWDSLGPSNRDGFPNFRHEFELLVIEHRSARVVSDVCENQWKNETQCKKGIEILRYLDNPSRKDAKIEPKCLQAERLKTFQVISHDLKWFLSLSTYFPRT